MTDTTKSIIRHTLTALGFLLGFLGVTKATGVLEIITVNFDGLWAAFSFIGGVAMAVIGFFRNKERLSGGASVIALLLVSQFAIQAQFAHRTVASCCPSDHHSGFSIYYSLAQADSLPGGCVPV